VFTHGAVTRQSWGPDGQVIPAEALTSTTTKVGLDQIYAPNGRMVACGHQVTDTREPIYIPGKGLYLDCGLATRPDGKFCIGILDDGQYIGRVSNDGFKALGTV